MFYPDISLALEAACCVEDEYLLFGSEEDGYYLEIPSIRVAKNKRFIRNMLKKGVRTCMNT